MNGSCSQSGDRCSAGTVAMGLGASARVLPCEWAPNRATYHYYPIPNFCMVFSCKIALHPIPFLPALIRRKQTCDEAGPRASQPPTFVKGVTNQVCFIHFDGVEMFCRAHDDNEQKSIPPSVRSNRVLVVVGICRTNSAAEHLFFYSKMLKSVIYKSTIVCCEQSSKES